MSPAIEMILKLKSLHCIKQKVILTPATGRILDPESLEVIVEIPEQPDPLNTKLKIIHDMGTESIISGFKMLHSSRIDKSYRVTNKVKIELSIGELKKQFEAIDVILDPGDFYPLELIEEHLFLDVPGIPLPPHLDIFEEYQPLGHSTPIMYHGAFERKPEVIYKIRFNELFKIGETVINPQIYLPSFQNGNDLNVEFEGHGYKFNLSFSVTMPRVPVEPACDALVETDIYNKIRNFKTSTKPSAWPKIGKEQLITDMKKRICKPYLINQKTAEFCGPAAIAYELVKRDPLEYIRICKDLYETGEFKSKNGKYSTSDKLRNSKVKKNLAPIDWMLLASLTEHTNALYRIDHSSSDFAMQMLVWSVKKLMKDILKLKNTDINLTIFGGELNAIRSVKDICNQGGVGILCIHSNMLNKRSVDWNKKWHPFKGNHIISYICCLDITENKIKFKTYTWGEERDLDISKRRFKKCLFAVVTGES